MSPYVDTCLFSAFTWIWYVLPKARVLRLGLWLDATHRWWKFWEARSRRALGHRGYTTKGDDGRRRLYSSSLGSMAQDELNGFSLPYIPP